MTSSSPVLSCGQNTIKVFFSAARGATVDLSYYISSGGALLSSGVDSVIVGNQDLEAEYVGEAETIDLGAGTRAEGTVLASHDISLER